MKIKLLILLVGLISVQCQVEKELEPISPFEKSLILNEYDYDAILSVINPIANAYEMDVKYITDSQKGTNSIVPYAQTWKDAIPITSSYKRRFWDSYLLSYDHQFIYEINGVKVPGGNKSIKPENSNNYPKSITEETKKSYEQFDNEIKNGTNWKIYFQEKRANYNFTADSKLEVNETIRLNGFPSYPVLEKQYTFEKDKDLIVNFPAIKNADVIYIEFSCGLQCFKKEEDKYQTYGWIKAVPGNATSVTLKKSEIAIMGQQGFYLNIKAVKAKVFERNGKKYLVQNISQNYYNSSQASQK